MLIGLPCMAVVGCLLARFRLHRWYFLAMRAFRNLPDSMKPKDVYKYVYGAARIRAGGTGCGLCSTCCKTTGF